MLDYIITRVHHGVWGFGGWEIGSLGVWEVGRLGSLRATSFLSVLRPKTLKRNHTKSRLFDCSSLLGLQVHSESYTIARTAMAIP